LYSWSHMQLYSQRIALEVYGVDLRIQKTLESIETEFLSLRAKTQLNKIKVNDLCSNARINKSTFYRHYIDIFDLSEKIENQTIDTIMRDFTTINLLFANPEEFINGLFSAFQKWNQEILILFSGRMDVLANKMEMRLKGYYLTVYCTPEDDIMISFVIGGAAHVFLSSKYDLETYRKEVALLLRKINSNQIS
jgi:AcrR family transcriptional regulator